MWIEKNKTQSSYIDRSKKRLNDYLLAIGDGFNLDIGSAFGLLIDEGIVWTERPKDKVELTTASGFILLTASGERIIVDSKSGWNERNKS